MLVFTFHFESKPFQYKSVFFLPTRVSSFIVCNFLAVEEIVVFLV